MYKPEYFKLNINRVVSFLNFLRSKVDVKSNRSISAKLIILLFILCTLLFSARIINSRCASDYFPIEYNLKGATSYVSGESSDIYQSDGNKLCFRSYFSAIGVNEVVDSISDIDSSFNRGQLNNFSAQQSGPDSIYSLLIEENVSAASNATLIDAESFEGGAWPPSGWTGTDAWNGESSQVYDGAYSADYDGPPFGTSSGDLSTPNLDCSDASVVYVDFWYRDRGCDNNDFLLRYYNGASWNLISDLGSTIQEDQWLHYSERITDNQYFVATFGVQWRAFDVSTGENIWVDLITIKKERFTYNYELDYEVQWTDVDYNEMNEELCINYHEGNNSHSFDATGGYIVIGDGTPDWGPPTGTISFWVKMDTTVQGRFWGQNGDMETRFSGNNIVLDWGGANSVTSVYSFSANTWYFIAVVWDENNDDLLLYVGDEYNPPTLDGNSLIGTWIGTTPSPTENRFLNGLGADTPVDGHGDDLRYWDIARNLTEIQGDYNRTLSGFEPNLRSYFKLNNNLDDIGPDNNDGSGIGSYSFSTDVAFDAQPTENIQIDVWDGFSWQNLFSNLTIGWNNISVSSYLNSSTFTTRFKGGIEGSDLIRDIWYIDVILLHVWPDENIVEVDFLGSSNTENWNQIIWTVVSSWTTDSVIVKLQLYNYSLNDFSPNGNGYINYISSNQPNSDENKNQTIAINTVDFRNITGFWKLKVRGIKATSSQFELKVDLIKCEVTTKTPQPPFDSNIALLLILAVLGTAIPFGILLRNKQRANKQKLPPQTFNERFNTTHDDIIGRKILLEVDPTVKYHKVLFNFISNAIDNGEPMSLFTRKNSALHTAFSGMNINLFLLTSKISSPKGTNKKELFLPMSDLSVLLNTFTKIIKKKTKKPITILFDNLSDTILMSGYEKTYKFMRFLLETISSPKITALFVFNPTAHVPAISSSIRGLFQFRLVDLEANLENTHS